MRSPITTPRATSIEAISQACPVRDATRPGRPRHRMSRPPPAAEAEPAPRAQPPRGRPERDDRRGRGLLGALEREPLELLEHRHVGERERHVLGGRVAARRFLGERAADDRLELARTSRRSARSGRGGRDSARASSARASRPRTAACPRASRRGSRRPHRRRCADRCAGRAAARARCTTASRRTCRRRSARHRPRARRGRNRRAPGARRPAPRSPA